MYNICVMLLTTILHHYFLWHYSRAFLEIFHVWINLLWFVVHFFSLPLLLKSLFSPWKRIVEPRGKLLDFEDFAGFVIIGLLSRVVGFFVRFTVIMTGSLVLLLTVVGGIFAYVFWLVAPVVLIGGLLVGLRMLFVF